jgi:MFS family permease
MDLAANTGAGWASCSILAGGITVWQVLREERPFRWVMAARAISGLGDWFSYFLMVVMAYDRTGQPIGSMAIVAAQAVATLVFSAVAGPLVDRRRPPAVMLVANVVRFGLVGALMFMPVSPAIYVADTFLVAGAAAFFNPADGKWTRALLPAERYGHGIAMLQVIGQLVMMVGPGLAVTVLQMLGADAVRGFGITAVSFLLAGVCVWASYRGASPSTRKELSQTSAPSEAPRQGWSDVLPVVMKNPLRSVLIVLVAVIMSLGGVDVVLLVFIRTGLHLSSLDVGYLVSALAVGVIVGSVAADRATQNMHPAWWLGAGLLGMGVFFALGAAASVLGATMLALALAGVFNGVINVKLATFIQTLVPMAVAGRVFALLGTLTAVAQLAGMGANTALLAVWGGTATLMAVGAWVAAAGLYGALVLARGRAEDLSAPGSAAM